MMLLAIVNRSAAAEWVQVAHNEKLTAYADLSTIRKAGNKVEMWHLFDYEAAKKDATGNPYMSAKSLTRYDCKRKQLRMLSFSFHSKNMSGGEMIYSTSRPYKLGSITQGSSDEILWKIACKKRGR